jgi:endonuclease-3
MRPTDADHVRVLTRRLTRAIPRPFCELDHDGPWQLLVATILSAQSTDKRVNQVTPEVFRRWSTPAALAGATVAEVEDVIRSTGFFRNKTKAIQGASRHIVEQHGGEVPRTMDAMTAMPGVARKTANVVLGTGYGLASGIVVDTHVGRVARRLGLTDADEPERVEQDLCGLLARRTWVDAGHRVLLHGRYLCKARSPACARCPLNELCPSAGAPPEGKWTARADAEWRVVEARGAGADGGDDG